MLKIKKKKRILFILRPKCILTSLKLTIIAFEQELVSICGHYRHHFACKAYIMAMYAIKYTTGAKKWPWYPQMLLKSCLNAFSIGPAGGSENLQTPCTRGYHRSISFFFFFFFFLSLWHGLALLHFLRSRKIFKKVKIFNLSPSPTHSNQQEKSSWRQTSL